MMILMMQLIVILCSHLCRNIIKEIVLMNKNALIPTRAFESSAGLDLYSSIDVNIDVGSILEFVYQF